MAPPAFLTTPNNGKPETVIVSGSESASVGAVNPKAVPVLSSNTVIALLSATGA